MMIAVGLYDRQVIKAYPHGGSSYVVAGKNLGEVPALIAAAGLMTDYVLTVAVSIASGTAAVSSPFRSSRMPPFRYAFLSAGQDTVGGQMRFRDHQRDTHDHENRAEIGHRTDDHARGERFRWVRASIPASSGRSRLRHATSQHLGEDDGVVVLRIVRGVHQRERALPRPASQGREPGALFAELLDVASTELIEPFRLMCEPLPQLRAGGKLLLPVVELGPVTRDATRPQPVDQDAVTVRRLRRVVCALQANIHRYTASA